MKNALIAIALYALAYAVLGYWLVQSYKPVPLPFHKPCMQLRPLPVEVETKPPRPLVDGSILSQSPGQFAKDYPCSR